MSLFQRCSDAWRRSAVVQIMTLVFPGFRKASRQLVKEKAANLARETRQQRRLKRVQVTQRSNELQRAALPTIHFDKPLHEAYDPILLDASPRVEIELRFAIPKFIGPARRQHFDY